MRPLEAVSQDERTRQNIMDALQTGKKFPIQQFEAQSWCFGLTGVPPSPDRVLKPLRCHKATPGCSIRAPASCSWILWMEGSMEASGWTKAMQYLRPRWQMNSAGAGKHRKGRSNKGTTLMPWSRIFQGPSNASWIWVPLFGSLEGS